MTAQGMEKRIQKFEELDLFMHNLGQIFFEETVVFGPVTVTVTGQCYEGLLCNPTILDLQQRGCVDVIIFMQDGVPPHIANPVNQLLRGHFQSARFIIHHLTTAWPPRSSDLIPFDF
ncbi:uncharacterized protein TNCV_2761921 [Trichonephila clavipes]|nr:uncharacterized protein TNCV_2761921 [Trichonephila clavipes]